MIEKKVYSGWSHSGNALEKMKINQEIYNEIKDKAKVEFVEFGYAHAKYRVLENPNNLTTSELALICDEGNLYFGHRLEGNYIVIHTD